MKKTELQKVIAIRQVLVEGHNRLLDDRNQSPVAIVKQADVGKVWVEAIKQIDSLLEENEVTFAK
tara:strand:- start:3405 stop:3599 length:195 start_codon:yes stop_codon:yes gene_type:complete